MTNVTHLRMRQRDARSVVGGTIIDEDHLVIGVVQAFERIQAGAQGAAPIVARHNNGNLRLPFERKIGCLAEHLLHGAKGILALAVARRQAHGPIFNLPAAVPPIIRITEDHRPRQAGAKRRLDLPREDFAFLVLTLAARIDAEFAQHQRFGVGDHLQAGEIVFERLAMVEIDVETDEIQVLRTGNSVGGKLVNVQRQSGSIRLASATSSSMKLATARAPLQRTMSGGISLATLKAKTAGCRAQAWTACRMASRASARRFHESRKHRCLFQGMSTSTRKPCSEAKSRNQRGGT